MSEYDKQVHNFGFLTTIVIIISMVAAPFLALMVSGESINVGATVQAGLSALAIFGPVAIIEFISYLPILGVGGVYLSFTTGNIMNMKLPAAQSGLKLAGVESGSPEADVVAVVSIAVSSLVTTAILLIGMLMAAQLLPLLESPTLAPAFNNLMPAIMGALTVPALVKSPKVASLPTVLAVILTIAFGYAYVASKQTYFLPVFLVISLVWAYFLDKKGLLGKK